MTAARDISVSVGRGAYDRGINDLAGEDGSSAEIVGEEYEWSSVERRAGWVVTAGRCI
jgi:hypothetical protein